MQRLLVSVRGPKEAKTAVRGGAHIIDAEYPFSALGSAYPLNILAIRQVTPADRQVSTNIGEKQYRWSTSSQAALGVALAGADVVKVGLGGFRLAEAESKAVIVMDRAVRNVKWWFPRKTMVATLFADYEKAGCANPIRGPTIAEKAKADGLLIDTYDKTAGKSLLTFLELNKIRKLAEECRAKGLEFWVAGSLKEGQLPSLWKAGVDVVCVRGAACKGGRDRKSEVDEKRVRRLVTTIGADES